jgi:SprT protein
MIYEYKGSLLKKFHPSCFPEKIPSGSLQCTMKSQYEKILSRYIPADAVSLISDWIIHYGVHLTITRERASKLGDFRPSCSARGHRITVNHNLNPYAFLLTLVHEIAHLETWNNYRHRARPHGTEWKLAFVRHMQPFLQESIFPMEVLQVVRNYLDNPAASSCTDEQLTRALRQFDISPPLFLEDLPEGSVFKIGTGRVFRKGHKRRKHFHCIEVASEQAYLISPAAEVVLLS